VSVIEHRRLIGLLLLWALLPLPFLYIVLPPFWLAAAAVGLVLALRPGNELKLSGLALNALGLAIVVVVLAVGGLRISPLRPLGHLVLLLTAVRALTVSDRRSFLRALLPVFLVWLVAVTSSTHLAVVPYFAASAAVWWWTGMRLLLVSALGATFVDRSLPRLRHAAFAAAAALVLAALVFLVMPRLREPWLAGRGGASSVTGFTSQVELGGVGTIRESPAVAMLVRSVSGERLESRWMRMRATALERVTLDSWSPRGAQRVPRVENGLIRPYDGDWSLDRAVEIEIELIAPRRYLFLPEGTVALAVPAAVRLDPANGVALAERVRGPLRYRVWVARGKGPRPADPPPAVLPSFEPHPEVRRLTLEVVAGIETDVARAAAVERHLRENYAYSMAGMASLRSDPVAWFLLERRAGHCEYFAGAMVAILADLGIPARMVTGYVGGDLSRDGASAVVREANAHAWVEARVGHGAEWTSFDPTPAAEVPALNRLRGRDRLRFSLALVESTWDRYILTYGFGEQVQLLSALAGAVDGLGRRLSWTAAAAGAIAVLGIGALVRWLLRRPARRRRLRGAPAPAASVIERVACRLQRAGVEVPASATVGWIRRRAQACWPQATGALEALTGLAERELYAADGGAADRGAVRALWRQARRGMKRTGSN